MLTIAGFQNVPRLTIILASAVLLLAAPVHGWPAKVTEVPEGDTLVVLHNGSPEVVRLFGIDCPEKGQAYAYKAKMATARMTAGRIVHVKPAGTDRYGRTLAWVNLGPMNINLRLVERGFAWHYKNHGYDKKLAEAEKTARKEAIGLWEDPEPVPPWIFRLKKGAN